jgi:hypothetical protein
MYAVTHGAEVLWAYYWPALGQQGAHEAVQQSVSKIGIVENLSVDFHEPQTGSNHQPSASFHDAEVQAPEHRCVCAAPLFLLPARCRI